MDNIKKVGIIGGAAVGGIIGGTVSFVGKMSKVKFLDDLGGNIMDSTITTGGIVGEAASGVTHVVSGKIQKQDKKVEKGKANIKKAGGKLVGNWVHNVVLVVDESSVVLDGVLERDKDKIKSGVSTLGKVATVGFTTCGAIQVPVDRYAEKKRKVRAAKRVKKSGKRPDKENG